MDPVIMAGMIFTLLVLLLIGGFVTLLPITRRLGALIEVKIREKGMVGDAPDLAPLLEAVRGLEAEMRRMNERQEFTEGLLAGRLQAQTPEISDGRSAASSPRIRSSNEPAAPGTGD